MLRIWSLSIILLFCSYSITFSQACCSGGVPISGNLGLSSKQEGTIQIQLSYDWNHLQSLLSGSERLNDQSRIRNTHSLLLETSYDITHKFSVSGLFTFVRQERIILTRDIPAVTINQGPGDGIILIRYTILPETTERPRQLTIGGGPKFPIGRSDHTDENGIILPADLQPGTGAWDILFWGQYAHSGLAGIENLSILFTSTYRYTTSNRRYNGQQSYRFGNEWQLIAGFSHRWILGNQLIDPSVSFRFRNVLPDQVGNSRFDNTGGSWLFLRPAIQWPISPDFSLRLAGDIPLFQYLKGTQLTTSWQITFSLYYQLQTREKSQSPGLPDF